MDGAVGELQSGQREVTAILRENGMKLQRLIENLLSFSAWQAKSVGLEVSEFKLRPLIKNGAREPAADAGRAARAPRRAGRGPDADRRSRQSPADPRQSAVERDQIHAARRHDLDPCPQPSASSWSSTSSTAGPGVPAEERKRIFEAFYQGKTPQGGHVKGTGIGLSVVTEFVNAHGGSIEILEAPTGGAHFRVRLPLRHAMPPNPRKALMRLSATLRARRARPCAPALRLGGCAVARAARATTQPPTPRRGAPPTAAGPIAPLTSSLMSSLPQGDPARQAELFQSAKDAAELTPTTSNRLRYALALATPGHSGSDPVAAERQLVGITRKARDSAAGRAHAGDRGVEAGRAAADPAGREPALAGTRRARCQTSCGRESPPAGRDRRERAPAQGACEDARAKLEAVTHIERTINDRGTGEPPHAMKDREDTRREARERLFKRRDDAPSLRTADRQPRDNVDAAAAQTAHPGRRRRPGPAAPADHPAARRELRGRGGRKRRRRARRVRALPAGSRHHGSAHGSDGRHRPAQGTAEPLAGSQGHHPDRARHDPRRRARDAERRVRLSDQAGRQAGTARPGAEGAQGLGLRARGRGLARQHHHAQPADGGQARPGQHGRRHRCARADHRRRRHRQGTAGARDPRGEPAAQSAVRRRQLQRDRGEPARVGAVRPRKRRVCRRDRARSGACSRPPTAARCCSTTSASCRMRLQVKLLRVLQENQIRPVGGRARSRSTCA